MSQSILYVRPIASNLSYTFGGRRLQGNYRLDDKKHGGKI